MDKVIDINNSYPFYANYFHPILLSKKENLFDKEDHNTIASESTLVNKVINLLEQGGILKLEGESELLIPLRGLLVLPNDASDNIVPLVLIGHGQALVFKDSTDNEILSYTGYQVLQKQLAKCGIASYSINLNIVNALSDNNESSQFNKYALDNNQRVLLFFLHLMLLKIIAGEPVSIPAKDEYRIKFLRDNKLKKLDEEFKLSSIDPALQELRDELKIIDFEKLGFMGHSRGADAVSRIPAYFYKKPTSPDEEATSPGATFPVNDEVDIRIKEIAKLIGKPQQDFIKCILALQPVSEKNPDPSKPHGYVIDNAQTMYFVVSSTHDETVTLDPIRIYEYPSCPKAMIVIKNATHSMFNSVWRALTPNRETIKERIGDDMPRLLCKDDHDKISKNLFASCFDATMNDKFLHYILLRHSFLTDILKMRQSQPSKIWQAAWEYGFPTDGDPDVFKKLDDKLKANGVPEEQLKALDYPFEQEDIKAFFIEIQEDNLENHTIKIPLDPTNVEENLSTYSHFSFRFAKGFKTNLETNKESKNFTIQFFENDSQIELISGEDIDSISLQALWALDLKEDTGKRKFETSILLQTVEIRLARFAPLDLARVNRIEITIIPDKSKLPPITSPPLSTSDKIKGSVVAGGFGAAIGLGMYLFIAEHTEEIDYNKWGVFGSIAGGGGIGILTYLLKVHREKNAYVFKDFLLTKRSVTRI